MVETGIDVCPHCGGDLKHYDKVKRIVKKERGKVYYISLNRYYCILCGRVVRELTDTIVPFKHYEKRIIFGVINGSINSNMEEYEDYPCEKTMKRWIAS